jgi:NitT/TauT family transport system substrate-binding protein
MIRRRDLLRLAPVWLAAGCERTGSPAAGAPIRIGAYFWPGFYWVDIAHHQGSFKQAGLNVERVDTNPDYFDSMGQLVTGRLDIVGFTQFDLIVYNARGQRVVGFLAGDTSHGAEALVARPGIRHIGELVGKRLALSKGTYLEYVWAIAAGRAAIDPGAAQIVDVPGEKAHELLARGEADAILTWEPFATQGLEAVRGTRLFDTAQVDRLLWTIFATRPEFLAARAADLQVLAGVWLRTTTYIQQRPEQAFAIVAEVNRKSVAAVRELAAKDRIADLRENLAAFSLATGVESLHGSTRRMNDYMIRRGLVSTRLDTSELFDDRFVRAVQQVSR